MRLFNAIAAASILIAGTAAVAATDHEAELAKMLDSRTPGKPVSCLYQHEITDSQIIDGTAIVYRVAGGTLYVNRPASGANFLSRDNILLTDTHTGQLCNVDIVTLLDQGTHMRIGTVGLGMFVPYTKSR